MIPRIKKIPFDLTEKLTLMTPSVYIKRTNVHVKRIFIVHE
jgi:hypothetical protein